MGSHPLPPVNPWLWSQTLGETCAAGLDPQGIGRAQRGARLARLQADAFARSPLYRARWPRGRDGSVPLEALEPVHKRVLMQHFDDWATDRDITRRSVDEFLADPARWPTPTWAATWYGPARAPAASRASSCRTSRRWPPTTRWTRCACRA